MQAPEPEEEEEESEEEEEENWSAQPSNRFAVDLSFGHYWRGERSVFRNEVDDLDFQSTTCPSESEAGHAR